MRNVINLDAARAPHATCRPQTMPPDPGAMNVSWALEKGIKMEDQTYYVHSLTVSSPVLGPFRCSPNVNIADHLPHLLKDKLPSANKDRVFVVVYPCNSCLQICGSSVDSIVVDIYELLLESQEPGVSLDDVRNQLCVSYGGDRDLLEGETLCVWTAMGDLERSCK